MRLFSLTLAVLVFWSLVVSGAFLTVSAGPVVGALAVALGVWTMVGLISVLVRHAGAGEANQASAH